MTKEKYENEKPEWQDHLEKLLKDSYLSGASKGGKTFVGVIYEIILEDKKKRKNPANTVMRIEATCKRLLGMNGYNPDSAVDTTLNGREQEG